MSDGRIGEVYLESTLFRFRTLKGLGEGAIEQLSADELTTTSGTESNSIAVIMQHLHGNMMSRWTKFLTSDGEKPSRDRDQEFELQPDLTREDRMQRWNEGWACLLGAVESLKPEDLAERVRIRGQELFALDAIQRQVAHIGYHVGQIVMLAKDLRGSDWVTLSVARGQSLQYRPSGRD